MTNQLLFLFKDKYYYFLDSNVTSHDIMKVSYKIEEIRGGCMRYSVSELAQLVGVTKRQIRFYEEKGLLQAIFDEKRGMKTYNEAMREQLYLILFLQTADFSLQDIDKIIETGLQAENLIARKDALKEKQLHIEAILAIIDSIEHSELAFSDTIDMYSLLLKERRRRSVGEQYSDSENFQSRLQLHQQFSTNRQGWQNWVIDQLAIPEYANILEIGCGTGELWAENRYQKLPKNVKILLTDTEQTMLEICRYKFRGIPQFRPVRQFDLTADTLIDEQFDVIIVNHVLQLFDNSMELLKRITKMLKPNGKIYASTVGIHHMYELEKILQKLDKRMTLRIENQVSNFSLEKGAENVPESLTLIDLLHYQDSLLVNDIQPLMQYIYSTKFIGNVQQFDSPEFKAKLATILSEEIEQQQGAIAIQKHTGMFVYTKK